MYGKLFGSKEQAPVYFAGTLAIIALVGICVVAALPASPDKADLFKTLGTIVLAALTFLGGVYGGSSK